MNPVALYFASGESLFSGAALLLLAITISPYITSRWLLVARNVLGWVALTMVVMASPPFSSIVDFVFLSAFGLWFIFWNLAVPRRTPRLATASVLAGLLLVLPVLELRHRALPAISG